MRYGEIITLGRHRLMCGDATNREDVYRLLDGERVNLVLTDPPYGNRDIQHNDGAIGNQKLQLLKNPDRQNPGHWIQARKYPQIIGNDNTDAARKHYEIIKELCRKFIIWGGNYFADFLPISRGWLFWNKKTGKSDFGDGELAWSNVCNKVKLYEHLWSGCFRAGSWKLNYGGSQHRFHPTQKPVELHINILEDFTQPDDVILDCFGGSGTTLIAAEMAGRKCLMMEISPEYCEIIRERYTKLKEDYPLTLTGSDSTAQQAVQSQ